MPDMEQINHIRDLGSAGYSISKIHDLTGVDCKTIRKYLGMEDSAPPATGLPWYGTNAQWLS